MCELYYWRKTILALMLVGIFFYALIPSFGMVAHRFLPPHEHLFLGNTPRHQVESAQSEQLTSFKDCFTSLDQRGSEERLVHSASDASSFISIASAIHFGGSFVFSFVPDVVARLDPVMPILRTCSSAPLDPPPNLNSFTLSPRTNFESYAL